MIRGGYGRTYDIGVFGSLFGHSVTQNLPVLASQELRGAENFDAAFTLARGTDRPGLPDRAQPAGSSRCKAASSPGRCPGSNGRRRWTRSTSRCSGSSATSMSVEVGYVANRGRDVFAGDGPAVDVNEPTLEGFPSVPQNQRRPFFADRPTAYLGLGGAYGWTQGIDYFCNCANNWYDSLQAKFNKRFSDGYAVHGELHLAEGRGRRRRRTSSGIATVNKGVTGWDRTHIVNVTLLYELPFGRSKADRRGLVDVMEAVFGGWQFNATHTIQSGVPFDVGYADSGAGSRHRTGPAESHRRSGRRQDALAVVQHHAHRGVRERVWRPGDRNLW